MQSKILGSLCGVLPSSLCRRNSPDRRNQDDSRLPRIRLLRITDTIIEFIYESLHSSCLHKWVALISRVLQVFDLSESFQLVRTAIRAI